MSTHPLANGVVVIASALTFCSTSVADRFDDLKVSDKRTRDGVVVPDERGAGEGAYDSTEPTRSDGDSGGTRDSGPDLSLCQLYGLSQFGRLDDVVGLSMSVTSWNIGDVPVPWYAIPSSNHPFLGLNMYRLKTANGSERFEQIGQAWLQHGFYALNSAQCSTSCQGTNGTMLGIGCTDTYSASLIAQQGGLGPRFEINPWTRGWTYVGWHSQGGSHSHNPVQHRLQVHDADLDPAQNPGATYYGETSYVSQDDIHTMNNAAWKPFSVSGSPGGTWSFDMTGSGAMPEIGFTIDAWESATQTVLAQEVPVVEFESPDGRCILAAEATDRGNGMWHYEYALLNVDMDRQVGSFSIPIAPGTTVTNVGFHAVEHHDEEFNTTDPDAVPIDNARWGVEIIMDAVTWSTTSNPLRWGTVYNFRFDADAEPFDTTVTLGLFRSGEPATVSGTTIGPFPDAYGLADFVDFQNCFGSNPPIACDRFDYESDGDVDLDDYSSFLSGLVGP